MDSLADEMDQSTVKTEPDISAENFEVGGDASNSDDDDEIITEQRPDQDDNSVDQSMEQEQEEIKEESPTWSTAVLTIDEKIQIANFHDENKNIPIVLVRENFCTKFKKHITSATLQQIISTGMCTLVDYLFEKRK